VRKVINRLFMEFTNWGDLLFAASCPLCQRSAQREVCQDCWTQIQQCQWKHSALGWGNAASLRLSDQLLQLTSSPDIPVFAWGHYRGTLKRSIAALKYDKQRRLARPLGSGLAEAWMTTVQPPLQQMKTLTVVPIPLHASKQQERGFNQAERLGRSFCQQTGLPLQPHGLIRRRATEAQFRLSPQERQQNLYEAFELGTLSRQRSRSTTVLLLDDIYTTGATARAAVQVLQRHHIPVYGIVAVARAGKIQENENLSQKNGR
jgi:ComF family protein